ncbi:hypothetical protein GBF38_005022 [Nibea albiflora]|uniref:Uncharacterized protein n=1 Tax=Nibea albiflora TaxID=240163 RepID=A0ACB7EV54_NIBAL|nr:hypothetical protein GBF38_005022 [Nibea albiflora]
MDNADTGLEEEDKVEEGEEEVELVIDWEEVNEDEEEKGVDDGWWDWVELVEEVKEDSIVEGEDGWTEGKSGGMEIGDGEGRAERAAAVLGWFFTEVEKACAREVCMDTRDETLFGWWVDAEKEGVAERAEAETGLVVLIFSGAWRSLTSLRSPIVTVWSNLEGEVID